MGGIIGDAWARVLSFCVAGINAGTARPLVVGLQAPQGAGKTTLSRLVLSELPKLGLRGASLSIDDFYLTRDEQLRLAAANPGNPYLEHRGYPGTHDVDLGAATLSTLRSLGDHASARVPAYDKSAHTGRGDRAPIATWPEINGPLDLVILEGWMLGFESVPDDQLPDPRLAPANRALASYDRWHRLIDRFVVMRALDPTFVLHWRVQAEEEMKASGRPGLTRDQIEDYIRRFLPAYAVWAGRAPARFGATPEHTLVIDLDEDRRPR